MTKKLDAEAIAGAVHDLEMNARAEMRNEILSDLEDFARDYEKHNEPERLAGFRDAIATIKANW